MPHIIDNSLKWLSDQRLILQTYALCVKRAYAKNSLCANLPHMIWPYGHKKRGIGFDLSNFENISRLNKTFKVAELRQETNGELRPFSDS